MRFLPPGHENGVKSLAGDIVQAYVAKKLGKFNDSKNMLLYRNKKSRWLFHLLFLSEFPIFVK